MRLKSLLLLFLAPSVLFAQAKPEHDLSVYALANYTTPSLGVTTHKSALWQTDALGYGGAAYFETWKHNNGFIVGGSYTATRSELLDLSTTVDTPGPVSDTWHLDRYKGDGLYEHRFRLGKRFRPYLGIGGYFIILWGGNAPAHSNTNTSGFDGLGGVIAPAGIRTELSPRISLDTGALVDFGKASTYGDQTYTASQNLMFEPRIGLSFRLGK